LPTIHPTAIVDPQAQLADDVEVGPWCLIKGPVTLGPGCRLLERVSLRGPLTLGENNLLYPGVIVGLAPQDLKFDPRVDGAGIVIGNHNILRENITIHRATKDRPTTVGCHNYIMANSHLGHDVLVGDHCMLANNAMLGGHVTIQDRAILGGNATVHQFCRVGRLAMISGLAGVSQDVPPFCTVYNTRRVGSLNLVGLRRNGLQPHIDALKVAFNLLYRRRLAMPNALSRIQDQCGQDPLCRELLDFCRTTHRGITGYAGSEDYDEQV
jgi:UDP-N-acetylglucosamine acyltransferase